MRAHCRLVLALGAVLTAVLMVVPTAIATAPTSVSGVWSTTPLIPTGFKQAGVNIKLPGFAPSAWAGDLSGTTIYTTTFIIHPDGSIGAAPIRETFTGAVTGVGTGTLDFVEEAHASPDGSTQIDATIIGGTGDLAALHGRVIFLGTCDVSGACTGTYSGQIHG